MTADNARAKKRNTPKAGKPVITRFHNGTVLISHPDGRTWFGLWRHLRGHL
jgi:hypothetical protein